MWKLDSPPHPTTPLLLSSGRSFSYILMSVGPSEFLIWNVRGLNRKSRRDVVRVVVNYVKPDLICLQETKKMAISRRMVLATLGVEFSDFVFLPAAGTRGGFWLLEEGMSIRL
jgi:hypothetical protein